MKTPSPKLLISALAALAISALLFAGCDTFESQSEQPPQFENPYAQVGRLHNQSLDHVLADLKAVKGPLRGREALLETAEASTREFFREKSIEAEGFDAVEMGMNLVRQRPNANAEVKAATQGEGQSLLRALLPDSVRSEMTAEQKQYVGEVLSLIKSKPPVHEFEAQLATLSKSALDELGEEEAKVVLYTSAVAKSSYSYWRENLGEWTETILTAAARSDSVSVISNRAGSSAAASTRSQASGGLCGEGQTAVVTGTYTRDDGTTVVTVTCFDELQVQDNGSNGGSEGYWGSLADIAVYDATGAATGAVSGLAAAGVGAGPGALVGGGGASAGKTVWEAAEWLGWTD